MNSRKPHETPKPAYHHVRRPGLLSIKGGLRRLRLRRNAQTPNAKHRPPGRTQRLGRTLRKGRTQRLGRTWHGPEQSIEYLAGITAFTDILAANGYRCAISGKWHLGASDVPQKSHDFWCVHALGGDSYTDYWVFDNSSQMTRQTEYVSHYFTNRAIAFLEAQANTAQPFCLSVHYTAPHAPWRKGEQPAEIWDAYANTEFSLPREQANPMFRKGRWNPSEAKRRETITGYFTAITAMDRAIGRLIDKLDALAPNTIVIFTSDNGFNMGHHGILGKGTFPLNMYEESVKVPFIVRLPRRFAGHHFSKSVVNYDLISHYNFMPTILDCLGLENPLADRLPGSSFAAILRGEKPPQNKMNEQIVICDEYGPNRMLRTREWKYIQRYPDGQSEPKCELYCLAKDPREHQNLIDNHQYREVQLERRLSQWFLCSTGTGRGKAQRRFGAARPNRGVCALALRECSPLKCTFSLIRRMQAIHYNASHAEITGLSSF